MTKIFITNFIKKIEINELRIFVLKNFYEYYKIIINEIEN